MIEFFLSKVWLYVCGILVTAVLVMAFVGLNHGVADDEAQQRVDELARTIEQVSECDDDVSVTVQVDRFLVDDEGSYILRNGSLWLESGGVRKAADLPSNLTILGMTYIEGSEGLRLSHGTVLRISTEHHGLRSITTVQVENVRTVSLMA